LEEEQSRDDFERMLWAETAREREEAVEKRSDWLNRLVEMGRT
jgi:hypothetical protein